MTLAIGITTKTKTIFVADKRQIFSSPLLGYLGHKDDARKIYKVDKHIGLTHAGDGSIGSLGIDYYLSGFTEKLRKFSIKNLDEVSNEFTEELNRLARGIAFSGSFIIGGYHLTDVLEPELYSCKIPGEAKKVPGEVSSVGCNDILEMIESGREDELLSLDLIKGTPLEEDLKLVIDYIKQKKFLSCSDEEEVIKILAKIIEITHDVQESYIKKHGASKNIRVPFVSRTYDVLVLWN